MAGTGKNWKTTPFNQSSNLFIFLGILQILATTSVADQVISKAQNAVKSTVVVVCQEDKHCLNGGVCIINENVVAGSYCHCKPHFVGDKCQFRHPCYKIPTPSYQNGTKQLVNRCEGNSGICHHPLKTNVTADTGDGGVGTTPSWHNEKESEGESPCINNGRCELISEKKYRCICPDGFVGDHCEVTKDPCSDLPCQNGGSCTTSNHSSLSSSNESNKPNKLNKLKRDSDFECKCQSGYRGTFCELDVDECDIHPPEGQSDSLSMSMIALPCLNQGTCLNTPGSYKCLCQPEYTGDRCERKYYPCNPSPCLNRATCIITGDLTYKCQCQPGFSGKNCENNIDDCSPGRHKCYNGSTCLDRINSYTCQCPPQFKGIYCDEDVDECSILGTSACKNGGSCVNTPGNYYCACVNGWTGRDCGTNVDDCAGAVCLNGGTCHDRVGSYACECPPGKTGLLCHLDDVCTAPTGTIPCAPGALCETNFITGEFTCTCPPGWEGNLCDMDIDECLMGSPCEHGGKCVNTLGAYECACPSGYTGPRCEINVDECSSHPCLNSGTCLDEIDKFTCVCMPGYTGERCEVNINECAENPCENSGICTDLLDGFICTCPLGFDGKTCENRVNDACTTFHRTKGRSPCKNGGACVSRTPNTYSHDSVIRKLRNERAVVSLEYYCRCPEGWEGVTCQISTTSNNYVGHIDQVDGPATYTSNNSQSRKRSCPDRPCNHGGFCVKSKNRHKAKDSLPRAQQTLTHYECKCPPGFGGPYCEHHILKVPKASDIAFACTNSSAKTRCLNGGLCLRGANTYSDLYSEDPSNVCQCLAGFTGPRCETDVDECGQQLMVHPSKHRYENNLCGANSSCLNTYGSYICKCAQTGLKLIGRSCDSHRDAANNKLLTEMSCEIATLMENNYDIESYVSADGSSASGLNGETWNYFTKLASELVGPCHNGGTCQSTTSSDEGDKNENYRKSEITWFTFTTTSAAHVSSGRLELSFRCICRPGFHGSKCEREINECALLYPPIDVRQAKSTADNHLSLSSSNYTLGPCLNGGVCMDYVASFVCDCPRGWSGARCELNQPDCTPTSCLNGGVCVDGVADYACICPDGYRGKYCQTWANPCDLQTVGRGSESSKKAEAKCQNGGICVPKSSSSSYSNNLNENSGVRTFRHYTASSDHVNQVGDDYTCQCAPGYYGMYCENRVDPCFPLKHFGYESHPSVNHSSPEQLSSMSVCQNGGTCYSFPQSNEDPIVIAKLEHRQKMFHCECPPGWTGDMCDKKMVSCQGMLRQIDLLTTSKTPSVCRNGGKCVDITIPAGPLYSRGNYQSNSEAGRLGSLESLESSLSHYYKCECRLGFTGSHCEKLVDNCVRATAEFAIIPCLNGGTCQSLTPNLQRSLLRSDRATPVNSTITAGKQMGYRCECLPGFEGERCEMNIDDCKDGPCKNGGICHDLVNDFRCTCPAGTLGFLCETNVDECQGVVCHHGGTCVDKIGSFECICPPGFVGKTCEGDINECLTNPCDPLRSKGCVQLDNDFKCVCRPGFTGKDCKTQHDKCHPKNMGPNPCLNAGQCVTDLISQRGFRCRCKPGFEGDVCQSQTQSCVTHPCHDGEYCLESSPRRRCFCDPDFGIEIIKDTNSEGGRNNRCWKYGMPLNVNQTLNANQNVNHINQNASRDVIGVRARRKTCARAGCPDPVEMPGNGRCDEACNLAECEWDGRDCSLGLDPWKKCLRAPFSGLQTAHRPASSPTGDRNAAPCWLLYGDGVCDPQCDNRQCLFDGFDCRETRPPWNETSSSEEDWEDQSTVTDIASADKGTLIVVLNSFNETAWDHKFSETTWKSADSFDSRNFNSYYSNLIRTLSDLLRTRVQIKRDRWGNPMIFPTLIDTGNGVDNTEVDLKKLGSKLFLELGSSQQTCGRRASEKIDKSADTYGQDCVGNVIDAARFIAAQAAQKKLPQQLASALVAINGEGGLDDDDYSDDDDDGSGRKDKLSRDRNSWSSLIFGVSTGLVLLGLVVGVLYTASNGGGSFSGKRKRKVMGHGITWFPEGFALSAKTSAGHLTGKKRFRKESYHVDDSVSTNYVPPSGDSLKRHIYPSTADIRGEPGNYYTKNKGHRMIDVNDRDLYSFYGEDRKPNAERGHVNRDLDDDRSELVSVVSSMTPSNWQLPINHRESQNVNHQCHEPRYRYDDNDDPLYITSRRIGGYQRDVNMIDGPPYVNHQRYVSQINGPPNDERWIRVDHDERQWAAQHYYATTGTSNKPGFEGGGAFYFENSCLDGPAYKGALNSRAAINARGPGGITPLMLSASSLSTLNENYNTNNNDNNGGGCAYLDSGIGGATTIKTRNPGQPGTVEMGGPINPTQFLILKGADIDARTDDTMESPLHLAARFARADSARFLLEAGADINATDYLGRTPLHTAIAADAVGVFHLLINFKTTTVAATADSKKTNQQETTRGTNQHNLGSSDSPPSTGSSGSRSLLIDWPASDGTTPLILAARVSPNDSEIPAKLIELGADVNVSDELGRTALHWAAAVNNFNTVSLLLKKSSNPNAQDLKDETPLFLAAREGSFESAKILFDYDANADVANNLDVLPLDIANERLHTDIRDLIAAAGTNCQSFKKKSPAPCLPSIKMRDGEDKENYHPSEGGHYPSNTPQQQLLVPPAGIKKTGKLCTTKLYPILENCSAPNPSLNVKPSPARGSPHKRGDKKLVPLEASAVARTPVTIYGEITPPPTNQNTSRTYDLMVEIGPGPEMTKGSQGRAPPSTSRVPPPSSLLTPDKSPPFVLETVGPGGTPPSSQNYYYPPHQETPVPLTGYYPNYINYPNGIQQHKYHNNNWTHSTPLQSENPTIEYSDNNPKHFSAQQTTSGNQLFSELPSSVYDSFRKDDTSECYPSYYHAHAPYACQNPADKFLPETAVNQRVNGSKDGQQTNIANPTNNNNNRGLLPFVNHYLSTTSIAALNGAISASSTNRGSSDSSSQYSKELSSFIDPNNSNNQSWHSQQQSTSIYHSYNPSSMIFRNSLNSGTSNNHFGGADLNNGANLSLSTLTLTPPCNQLFPGHPTADSAALMMMSSYPTPSPESEKSQPTMSPFEVRPSGPKTEPHESDALPCSPLSDEDLRAFNDFLVGTLGHLDNNNDNNNDTGGEPKLKNKAAIYI